MYWGGISGVANPAAAYQTSQTGYAVSHTPAAGTYTPQRAQTYDTNYQNAATSHASAANYSTPSTTYDYGYSATRPTAQQQNAAAAAAAAAVYDTSKSYYGQPAAAAATAATSYTAADTHYQNSNLRQTSSSGATSKTSYSSGYSVSSASQGGYGSSSYAQQQSNNANKVLSSGNNMYVQSTALQQQQQQQQSVKSTPNTGGTWSTGKKATMGGGGGGNRNQNKNKPQPRQQQLHYCDVCKISCAGPLTYREHLEGQKHKKKEAAVKAGPTPPSRLGGGASLRCELCDVTCTGNDAYAAHIRGAKHQKVVKLHTKLGKPIPSSDPVVVGIKPTSGSSPTTSTSVTTGTTATKTTGGSTVSATAAATLKKEEVKDELMELREKEVEPVGQEYIEEIKSTEGETQGKVISFNCKLCECRFNDPNAKEMHMKGRRHRLQYKKKVNPDLQVEVKPSIRHKKMYEEKIRRQQLREDMWRRREEERMMEEEDRWFWHERRPDGGDFNEWYRGGPYPPPPPRGPLPHPGAMHPRMPFMPSMHPMMMRKPDSSDDRHVIAKHADIYPLEDELSAIQKIVSNTEKALKCVSDYLAELDAPKDTKPKEEKKDGAKDAATESKKEDPPARMLKGVMRVGILAKGLLLRDDTRVELVVLCGEKPTRTLLDRVADALPQHLAKVAPNEKYEVQRVVEDAAITVSHEAHTVTVTLTAPILREQLLQSDSAESQVGAAMKKDAPDVLDKQKCLAALASLRHAKWFQARATGLFNCVMVIRIMRDLCQRVPTWRVLNSWALELIVEKVMASAGQPLSPGEGVRRVIEAVASGLLLPGAPGLLDPCEKDPIDAAAALKPQEREDVTSSAQHALRLIAFRQIHKVLEMDALPPPKFTRHSGGGGRFNRKRRRDNSTGEGGDSETEQDGEVLSSGEGKKDKKELDAAPMETDKSK